MKKFLALLLALVMIFALTACGKKQENVVLKIGVSTADTDPRNIAAQQFADEAPTASSSTPSFWTPALWTSSFPTLPTSAPSSTT